MILLWICLLCPGGEGGGWGYFNQVSISLYRTLVVFQATSMGCVAFVFLVVLGVGFSLLEEPDAVYFVLSILDFVLFSFLSVGNTIAALWRSPNGMVASSLSLCAYVLYDFLLQLMALLSLKGARNAPFAICANREAVFTNGLVALLVVTFILWVCRGVTLLGLNLRYGWLLFHEEERWERARKGEAPAHDGGGGWVKVGDH